MTWVYILLTIFICTTIGLIDYLLFARKKSNNGRDGTVPDEQEVLPSAYLSAQQSLQDQVTLLTESIKTKQAELIEAEALVNETKSKYTLLINSIDDAKKELQNLLNTIHFNEQEMITSRQTLESLAATANEAVVRNRNLLWGSGHTLSLSSREVYEINQLLPLVENFSNPIALNKAIYEVYFRSKMKRLVELTKCGGMCGIYRIWCTEKVGDAEVMHCYVGQGVDIGDRWVTHLKRLVGAEAGTQVRFYDEAKKFIGELRWEVLEECRKEELNEKEHFWIEFYGGTTDWNMKK